MNIFDLLYNTVVDIDKLPETNQELKDIRRNCITQYKNMMNEIDEKGYDGCFYAQFLESKTVHSFYKYILEQQHDLKRCSTSTKI